jgi:peptidoglycan hydrolase-like protein with peptidoglycan-binding domain
VFVRALIALPPLVVALVAAQPAGAAGTSSVAALQVALRAHGFDTGGVDGLAGPRTQRAVRAFQARARLPVDGVVGPRTRRALGRFGRYSLGVRILRRGAVGWDVAELQFLLATRGFPSSTFDGSFGLRTLRAVRRFQRHVRLGVDGVVGPATIAALRRPPPVAGLALRRPVDTAPTDGFGPRGVRFHTGLDFPMPSGTPVRAARGGRVTFAAYYAGYGNLVSLAHENGVRTLYAHLQTIAVRLGARVAAGSVVGSVGATGTASGPHLHFEVRVRGAAVDPRPALGL